MQNTDGFFPQIFGVRALLLIPAVVCTAMFERDIVGMLFGLFAGMLWDITASGNNFNALYLLAVGFICGTLINTVMRNNVVTASLLSVGFIIIYSLGYWLFQYVFASIDGAAHVLVRYYLPGILYTAILVPIIFIIVRAVEKNTQLSNNQRRCRYARKNDSRQADSGYLRYPFFLYGVCR